MSIVITCYLNGAILYLYYIYQMFIVNKVKTLCSSGVNWINWLTRSVLFSSIECKFVLHTNSPRKGGMIGTVYPNSSLKCNLKINSGFRILASPKVLQGAFGNSTCPTQHSQPCPMLANRHLTA